MLFDWPGESTIKQLITCAAGLFIWSETLICIIDNKTNLHNEKLELMLGRDWYEMIVIICLITLNNL